MLSRDTATYQELHALLARYAVRRDFPRYMSNVCLPTHYPDTCRFRGWDSKLYVRVPQSQQMSYAALRMGDTFAGFQYLFDAKLRALFYPNLPTFVPPEEEVFTITSLGGVDVIWIGDMAYDQRPSHYIIVLETGFVGRDLTGLDAPPPQSPSPGTVGSTS